MNQKTKKELSLDQYHKRLNAYLNEYYNEINFNNLKSTSKEFPSLNCSICDPMTNRLEHNGIWYHKLI